MNIDIDILNQYLPVGLLPIAQRFVFEHVVIYVITRLHTSSSLFPGGIKSLHMFNVHLCVHVGLTRQDWHIAGSVA